MTIAKQKSKESLSKPNKSNVFLVDDHPVVRQGLRMIIEQDPAFIICGESDSTKDALKQLDTLNPDILVTDLSLKDSNGLELVKHLRRNSSTLPILIFSIHDESVYAERALSAGANGYVMKQEDPDLLLRALHKVKEGDIHLSMKMTAQLLKKLSHTPMEKRKVDTVTTLSDRELEVFELIGKGLSTRKIAAQLILSIKTIETYRAHIKRKFNLSDATELTHRAMQWVDNETQQH